MKTTLTSPLPLYTIAQMLDCEIIGPRNVQVQSVVTSGTEAEAGSLFLAAAGNASHGIVYWKQAVAKGAVAIITDVLPEDRVEEACSLLLVRNTVDALFEIAKKMAQGIAHKTVAITGSVGKTTTRAYVEAILKQCNKIHSTQGNFNNHIGVPMTMLGMPRDTDWLIVECGMNHKGELSKLSELVLPDAVIITNIGTAHIGNFGTQKGIAEAKAELLEHLSSTGLSVLPAGEPLLEAYIESRTVTFSPEPYQGSYCIVSSSRGAESPWICVKTPDNRQTRYSLLTSSLSAKMASLRGIALADRLQISPEIIQRGLRTAQVPSGRGDLITVNGSLVIDDTYNGSYESMLAAFDSLKEMQGSKKIVCLGEMRELGALCDVIHRRLGTEFAMHCFDYLFLAGSEGAYVRSGAIEAGYPEDRIRQYAIDAHEDIVRDLTNIMEPDDIVLVKGAHSTHMEEVVRMLQKGDVV